MWWPLGCIRFIHSNWENLPAWKRWILSFIPFGAVGVNNSVGLTNPGFNWWINKVWPKIKNRKDLLLIISIFGTPEELVWMAEKITLLDDPNHIIVGIQVNGACPNSGEDLSENADKVIESCRRVAEVTRLPLSLSISVVHNIEKIVASTRGIVELYTINSVQSSVAFPGLKSLLAHLGGGGFSGKCVQEITWALAEKLEKLGVAVAWPSIWETNDLPKMRQRGKVKTVSLGSIYLCHPFRPDEIMSQENRQEGAGYTGRWGGHI
jgi:hypothetical protein